MYYTDLLAFQEELTAGIEEMQLLHQYAVQKSRAVHQRMMGCIDEAMAYEQSCDEIYKELPVWAIW